MRDFLRRAFVDNALLKVVSFALALVVFAVVRGDKDAVTGLYLKVDYLYPADRVLVSDEPVPEIRLTVRGPLSRVGRLDERDVEPLRVDLRDARDGEHRFSEELIRLPAGVRVATIAPAGFKVRFEPRAERNVPVQTVLEGEPAPGYRLVKSTTVPRTVHVVGAKSVVDGIARATTRPLRIAEPRETVRGEVQLAPPPAHARWTFTEPILVEVEVAPVLAEKVLRAVPVRVTGAARMEASTEPSQADVVLRGPAEALSQILLGTPVLLVDAQAEDARPAGVARKRINVVGLPIGVAAEVRPESVTLVTRRRRD